MGLRSSFFSRFLSIALLPFLFRVPLLKLSIRQKGTLTVKELLRNLVFQGGTEVDKPPKTPTLQCRLIGTGIRSLTIESSVANN